MYKHLRGTERLFRFGQWAIAVLFAYFLIQVGASLIADLPLLSNAPQFEDFLDKAGLEKIKASMALEIKTQENVAKQIGANAIELESAQNNYEKDKESFENWRATRSSTEQSDQSPAVIAKARQLGSQLVIQQKLTQQSQQLRQAQNAVEEKIEDFQQEIDTLNKTANERYEKSARRASLKDFFIRLSFVGPMLITGVLLFRHFRRSEYWPFVWGFILFSLFAFFFELVPYLPSFGGYIRYGVGAVLTLIGGRALIRSLQQYLEKKQQEQAAPQEERKQDIRYEKALEALAGNQCPSCERLMPRVDEASANYCMHCGLKIYSNCPQCGLRHNAFFPFCPSCGAKAESDAGTT